MSRRRWMVGSLGLLGTWVCGFAISSCLVEDPDHCRHQEGDASCSGATPYCDQCKSSAENGGCVADKPADDCYFAGDEPYAGDDSGESGTGTGTGDSGDDDGVDSDDGPPVACENEGDRDDACPDDKPFCVGATCVDCNEGGGDSLCADVDPSLPACSPAGQCTQCNSVNISACSTAKHACSPEGTCVQCTEHSDCGEHGCNLETNTCLGDPVYYVDAVPCPGFGSKTQPYCVDSLPSLDGKETTVHILGTDPIEGAIHVWGEGTVLVVIADAWQQPVPHTQLGAADAIRAEVGATVYVQGLTLTGDASASLRCASAATVWARDTDISGNTGAFGVLASGGCHVTLERVVVTDNPLGGVKVVDSTALIVSSVIAANGGTGSSDSPGLDLENTTAELHHTTLITNKSSEQGRNITCRSNDVSLSVYNSIVVNNPVQSILGCSSIELHNTAIDDPGLEDASQGVIVVPYTPTDFAFPTMGNAHLAGDTPYVDLARWDVGDPLTDLDGDPLNAVVGATNAVGADQP